MPINTYIPHHVDTSAITTKASQEALWRGERCIVFSSVDSLLSGGIEEITLALAEHAEQKKLTQETRRLLMTRRKKMLDIAKVRGRQAIHSQMKDKKEYRADDSE